MKSLTPDEFDFLMENATWAELYMYFNEEYEAVREEITEIICEMDINEFLENYK